MWKFLSPEGLPVFTLYGHMKSTNVQTGQSVEAGDVIGFVGATGVAFGPHLHFEVLVNGTQVNPQSVTLPTGVKLAGKELKSFLALVANIDRQRRELARADIKSLL